MGKKSSQGAKGKRGRSQDYRARLHARQAAKSMLREKLRKLVVKAKNYCPGCTLAQAQGTLHPRCARRAA